ncbi:hypothetical protein AMATHDRAFT_6754 [Amanita thiersii Skay4041]|uniref:DUF6534 domain-containing protein n=1 Tax=Amanita thiersii Skay4041 TaxID=703135 RepID=A0A2A9NBH7_9AGAR|nr:hypothetical protein AMATHDRAFT_6754 [Amanita thiersii Skay4041]
MTNLALFIGPTSSEKDDNLLGQFIGTLFNWALLGTLVLQVYLYQVSFPKDSLWIKLLVYGVFLFDLAQTACATHWAWHLILIHWGDLSVFKYTYWSMTTSLVLIIVVTVAVQLFFAWRIWKLRGDSIFIRFLSTLIVLISLMQGAAELAMGIQLYIGTSDVVQEVAIITKPVQVWLIGSFICDVIIACTTITILHQARKMSKPLKQTEDLVTKLIILTVETGAITAAMACIELVLFLVNTNNYTYFAPAVIFGKVYSNVLLANLNGRARMRTLGVDDPSMLVMHSLDTNALWGENISEETQTRNQRGIELGLGTGSRSFGTDTPQELSARRSGLGGREKGVVVSAPYNHEEIELEWRRGLEVKREVSL